MITFLVWSNEYGYIFIWAHSLVWNKCLHLSNVNMTYVSISPLCYVYIPLHHVSSQQPFLSLYLICAPISWCSDHIQHQKLNTKCNSRHLENNEAFTAIYGYSYIHVYKDYIDINMSITNKCQSDSCLLLYFEIYLKKKTAIYSVGNGD